MCSVGARGASAILTGAGTVLADDPALTVRLGGEEGAFLPPLRVVLDSRLRSLSCVKVRDGTAPTLYLHGFGVTSPVLQHVDFSEVQQRDAGLDLGARYACWVSVASMRFRLRLGRRYAGRCCTPGWWMSY